LEGEVSQKAKTYEVKRKQEQKELFRFDAFVVDLQRNSLNFQPIVSVQYVETSFLTTFVLSIGFENTA
jgi:hypothetical protein